MQPLQKTADKFRINTRKTLRIAISVVLLLVGVFYISSVLSNKNKFIRDRHNNNKRFNCQRTIGA